MKVSPSILSADFSCIGKDIEMINTSEADCLHLDIMDGVFVPNISFGFPVMEAISKISRKPIEAHLMIIEPEKWITRIRDIGVELLNVHQEACLHLDSVVARIHGAGMKAGVTLNPATPVAMLTDIITQLDLVLLMSVNPGFGGQRFLPNTLKKVKELRDMIKETGSKALIEVDGGVNETTGKELAKAGADVLVAGNYIFRSEDPKDRIRILKNL